MKKALVLLAMIVFCLSLCACGSSSKDTKDEPKESSATEKDTTDNKATDNEENKDTSTATIGDYKVTIKDYELGKDGENKDCVFVSFDFTNNSDDDTQFYDALYGKVFQNGVELDFGTLILDETSDPAFDNKYKEIQPGTTIELKEAYILQDQKSPITVKVVSASEAMGGKSEGVAKKEFNISE